MSPIQEPNMAERRAQILAQVGSGRISGGKAVSLLKRLAREREKANLAARRRSSQTHFAWLMLIRVTDTGSDGGRGRGRGFTIPLPLPLLWPAIPLAQWGLRIAARHAGDTGGIDLAKIPVGAVLASFLRTGGSGKIVEVAGDGQRKVEIWVW